MEQSQHTGYYERNGDMRRICAIADAISMLVIYACTRICTIQRKACDSPIVYGFVQAQQYKVKVLQYSPFLKLVPE